MQSNQTLIAILAVIVVGGGIFWYTQENQPAGEPLFAVSMICADDAHFIAEFRTDREVDIVVNGEIVRTVARTADAPQTFEDAAFTYVFAGEEAVVTDKASGASTTCSQPMDPNNAPMNFGDAGEGAGVQPAGSQPSATQVVSESIVGRWMSTTDEKFVREFKEGSVIDWYENEAVSTGTWRAFTQESAPEVSFPLESNTVYLELTMAGTQEDKLYFKLVKLTPESLQLIYMDRGGMLEFVAI